MVPYGGSICLKPHDDLESPARRRWTSQLLDGRKLGGKVQGRPAWLGTRCRRINAPIPVGSRGRCGKWDVNIIIGLNSLKARLISSKQDRLPGDYLEFVSAVNGLEPELRAGPDQALSDMAGSLKMAVTGREPQRQWLVQLFALVREGARREIGQRPYDVQLIGGLALYEGKIVQMNTGEGKTLAAVAPVSARALSGLGVHVLTFNDYLARRDAEWMAPIYRFLGLSVAYIQEGMSKRERQAAYAADVTYLTAKEAGFDFLRDGLAYELSDLVQRPFHAALVDEADSILIDEARVPLVIAGTTGQLEGQQQWIRSIVEQLQDGQDYAVDQFGRNVYLTESGSEQAEALLGSGDLYQPGNLQLLTELNLALHAEVLMRRDVDYIIRNGRVEIIDDFTGRVVVDRHWPHGLQTAIEVKEGLKPTEEGQVLGSITLQHFLARYPHLCGMTATAEPAAEELLKFYNLELLKVPPNKPNIRRDYPDMIFPDLQTRDKALVAEITRVTESGQPVLVGTTSVKASELLADRLRKNGVDCSVLNARRDEQEARIVADAGAIGAVTISTNMAGRGTDIKLGGQDGQDYHQVAALGGLYVIGANRHESRRIDDQLRGRAGRQGDPGSSRFFTSLEDELLARHKIADSVPERFRTAVKHDPIDSPILRQQVDRVQRIVEGQNFDIRQTLYRYATLVERQRMVIATRRRQLLLGSESPTLFQEELPGIHQQIGELLGLEKRMELERRLLIQATDSCWAEHLAIVTEIRDGIHLAEIGGLDPFREFIKHAQASFEETLEAIDQRALDKYGLLVLTAEGLSFDKLGLHGPSSTWTYLVDDHAFSDRLTAQLVGGRNVGFAAMAAFTGPLLMLWALTRRFRRRR